MSAANSICIDTFEVTQPIGTYYVGKASASDLLQICEFDFRRMSYKNGYMEFMGIQREVSDKRVKEIAAYCGTMDAVFPTAIVLSVPEKCVKTQSTCEGRIQRVTISGYEDPESPELNIPLSEVAAIIDGQHRLKGIEKSGQLHIETPVAIFVGSDPAIDATIFSVVNLAQTKVNKSLVYDLFALARTRSPEKTAHEIVVALDRMDDSPFHKRIKRLGTATPGRSAETLSQATMVRGLLPYITSDALADRDRGKRFGFWDPLEGPQNRRRIFFEFFRNDDDSKILAILLNYFSAIAERWPDAWKNTGEGNIINRTNGYNAFMRLLRPAYLNFTSEPTVVSQDQFASLFKLSTLKDDDFNPRRFIPGTSGATRLFHELAQELQLRP